MQAHAFKRIFRILALFALAFFLVGSGICPPELSLNRSTRKSRARKTILEVPVSFGKTHFIVGLSKEEVSQRNAQSSFSDVECTVNEAYFSPDDDLQQKIIDFIDQEKKGIYLAIFSFTNKNIADALVRAHKRGIEIQLVADPSFLHDRYTKIALLQEKGISVFVYDPKKSPGNASTMSNIMHNKFVLFLNNVDDKPLVWTGSFNFTKSACLSNQENVVVLNNPQIVNRYIEKFHELKKRAIAYNNIHAAAGRATTKRTAKNK
ncbi:MAG: phospholipase D-like domain-containing protein [Candidatus Dependentiae bacterium]